MTTYERSRRELFDALVEALGAGPAETMMDALPRVSVTELATRSDLRDETAKLRAEMSAMNDRLSGEMRAMDSRFAGQIAEVRGEIAEVRGDIAEVRGEIAEVRGELAEVRGEIVAVKGGLENRMGQLLFVVVGTQLATFLATIGFFVAFV
ncbi:MAG: hypothetical protein ACE367_18210 [Acidimicrobiales bacterium]